MISLKHNFLFVHVPKTAGNSIQNVLKSYSEDQIVSITPYQDGVERFEIRSDEYRISKHSTLKEYKAELGDSLFKKMFKFSCIRNPWDRLISYYFSPSHGRAEWNRSNFIEIVKQVPPLSSYFALRECENQDVAAFANVDYFIRFEQLNDDFKKACNLMEIPYEPLQIRNKSQKLYYKRYYDRETIGLVCRRFALEIEYFGYEY